VLNGSSYGMQLGVVTTLGEAKDLQFNRICYTGRQVEAASGISLRLSGDSSGNVSFNLFENIDIVHKNGLAIDCENVDNNVYANVRTLVVGGGSATNSIQFRGGASSNVSARGEQIQHLSCNLPVISKGTGTYTVGAQNNVIHALDKENSSPDPTIEVGSTLYWQNTNTRIYDGNWTSYTPTITTGTGSITTLGTVAAKYRLEGKTCFFEISVTITTNGTGATSMKATLPSGPGNIVSSVACAGYATATGKGLVGFLQGGTQLCVFNNSGDGSYPGADGAILIVNGFYEVA